MLAALVALAACEDTRRASRRERYEESGQSYGVRLPDDDDGFHKALEDELQTWKQALDNPSTRLTSIDDCKLSLDAGRSGWASMGCY